MVQFGVGESHFEYNGEKILASRLGYRITKNFAFRCMNKLFDEPLAVFNEQMLKPELQGMDTFVDGIKNIVEAQQKVALQYFQEGSVEAAIPPLKILLHIMAYGHFEGKEINHPDLRREFERDHVLQSEWYVRRLKLKQRKDSDLLKKQIGYLKNFINDKGNQRLTEEMNLNQRLSNAEDRIKHIESEHYFNNLVGTIGADEIFKAS